MSQHDATPAQPLPRQRRRRGLSGPARAGNRLWRCLLSRIADEAGPALSPEQLLEEIEARCFGHEELRYDLEGAWRRHFGLDRHTALRALFQIEKLKNGQCSDPATLFATAQPPR